MVRYLVPPPCVLKCSTQHTRHGLRPHPDPSPSERQPPTSAEFLRGRHPSWQLDDAEPVRGLERVRDFSAEAEDLAKRQRASCHAGGQSLTLEQFENEILGVALSAMSYNAQMCGWVSAEIALASRLKRTRTQGPSPPRPSLPINRGEHSVRAKARTRAHYARAEWRIDR